MEDVKAGLTGGCGGLSRRCVFIVYIQYNGVKKMHACRKEVTDDAEEKQIVCFHKTFCMF